MQSDEEKIQFILRFCDLRLERMTADELHRLKEETRAFLGKRVSPTAWDDTRVMVDELARVQNVLRSRLTWFLLEARRRESGIVLTPEEAEAEKQYIYFAEIPASLLIVRADASGEGRVTLSSGSVEADFLFALAVVLRGIDSRRLRQCPMCPTLFFTEDNRRKYCTALCGERARHAAEQSAGHKPAKQTAAQRRQDALFFPPALR